MKHYYLSEKPRRGQNKLYLSCPRPGFSTIELLIAFSIGIIFLSASLMLVFSDTEFNQKLSLETSNASIIDGGKSTLAKTVSHRELSTLKNSLQTDWNVNLQSTNTESYRENNELIEISPCVKVVSHNLAWTSSNRLQNTGLDTALGNKEIAERVGVGNCDPTPVSYWLKPESLPSNEITVPDFEHPSGIITKPINGKRYTFITSSHATSVNKPVFSVIDTTNIQLDSYRIKATLSAETGFLGLTIVGNYIYVLQDDVTNQLRIIDITNPENPILLPMQIPLLKITCAFDAQYCQSKARSITYYGGYLYVGTGYMTGYSPELHILCISDTAVPGCSATSPIETSQLNMDHNINDLMIKDDYAYLATSANYAEMTMIDISDKFNVVLPVNFMNPDINDEKYNAKSSTNVESNDDAFSIFVLGNYVYLGRLRVLGTTKKDFYVLDVSNPHHITDIGSTTLGMSGTKSYVSKIIINNKTGFVSTTDASGSLKIMDMSDVKNPKVKNNCGKINTSLPASALEVRDNLIFLLTSTSTATLKIFTDTSHECTI